MISSPISKSVTIRFVLRGLVQGQGVRPTIARLAESLSISGSVRNTSHGVEIVATAEPTQLEAFRLGLVESIAPEAVVAEVVKTSDQPLPSRFRIVQSSAGEQLQTTVPLDLAVCQDCLYEVRSADNRRLQYPFTTCTRCGPRYSILKGMPFDRDSTSMSAFPMCDACKNEYSDSRNRRYHAQAIACPDCGPQCWATDRNGNQIPHTSTAPYIDAIELVANEIAGGEIAAIKGIGGYQLVCDATDSQAVETLRHRKRRPTKPLPLMVEDVQAAHRFALIDEAEQTALESAANPIVLLRANSSKQLAREIAPNLPTIGFMLPTSPLHAMLIDRVGRPLVVTSGNVHGSPLVYCEPQACNDLGELADVFLHHNREIQHAIDDSVVQCVNGTVATIRAARGIAPLTFSFPNEETLIATGGHQKVSLGLQTESSLVLAAHIGDMETESCRIRFHESIEQLRSLYQIRPDHVVSDRHPNYYTSAWAETSEWIKSNDGSKATVQHHHAHVAAAMLENDLLDQTVLGIAFDGTGFGDDASIWGGEVILATTSDYQRIGHVRQFRLPGGESAIKRPIRIAQSLCSQLGDPLPSDPAMQYAIANGAITTSIGRLFDGVAAMVLEIESVDYDGEAAMRLEAACDQRESSFYTFAITKAAPCQFDWRPVISEMRFDRDRLSPGRIAMKFHRAVANLVVEIAERYTKLPCVLTGGVFQNRILCELIEHIAIDRQLDVRMPGRIPVNDGGLSIGQLIVAATVLKNSGSQSERHSNPNLDGQDGDTICA